MLVIVRANRLLATARKAADSGDRRGAATLAGKAYELLDRLQWSELTPLELTTISQVCTLWYDLKVASHRAEARALLRRAASAVEAAPPYQELRNWLAWAQAELEQPDVLPPPAKRRS